MPPYTQWCWRDRPQHRLGVQVDPQCPVYVKPLVDPLAPAIPIPVHQHTMISALGSLSTLIGNLDEHTSVMAAREPRDHDDGVFYGVGPSTTP